jgi:cytochrome c5
MRLHGVLVTVLWCGCLPISAQATGPAAQKATTAPKAPPAKAAASHAATDEQGEKKFQQNCNRCHNAPQELSPRITGTVLLHMRVRASLSEADERAILRYLAP